MKNEKTYILLIESLELYKDMWDFESVKTTYYKLANLDNKYYFEFLIWLADGSFLSDMITLISQKGEKFFRSYKKNSDKLTEKQMLPMKNIFNWYDKIFLPTNSGAKSNANEYEANILTLIRDANFGGLRRYIVDNSKILFKDKMCRDMVTVYALSILDKQGLFDNDVYAASILLSTTSLRHRVIIKLIIKNILDDQIFTTTDKSSTSNLINLLHKTYVAGGTYGRQLTKKIYSTLGSKIEFVLKRDVATDEATSFYSSKTITNNKKIFPSKFLGLKKKMTLGGEGAKKRPKVAICISGMTRGNNASIKSLYEKLVLPLEADVFVSTWDTMEIWPGLGSNGNTSNTSFVGRIFGVEMLQYCPVELNNRAIFAKFFPNIYKVLQSRITARTNISFYTDYLNIASYKIEDENIFLNSLPFDVQNLMYDKTFNQAKMFYKIYSATQLLLAYEQEHNIVYDYIIRTRPDIDYSNSIEYKDLYNINSGEIALSYTKYGPSDQLWIGNRNDMIKICSIWQQVYMTESFLIFKNIKCCSHELIMMYLAKNALTTCRHGLKFSLSGATKDMPVNISKDAISEDLATTGADYKDNDQLKQFFRLITKNNQVC
jgi:hypothetical protein